MKEWLINLSFRKRLLLLAIVGFLSSFAFTPYYQVWCLCVGLSALLFFAFYSRGYKESFLLGYVFGFFFFLGGLYWIANALFVDIGSYLYLVPLAIVAIPALLALYIACLLCILQYFNNKNSFRFAILFVCSWVVFELLRTYLFTGFPWLATGYSVMFFSSFVQSASVFGVFGLSFIVVSVCCIPFLLIHVNRLNIALVVCIAMIVLVNFAFGFYRLKAPTEYHDHYVVVVQPNISQQDKINYKKFADNLNKLVALTVQPKDFVSNSGYIIWPETALGHYYKTPIVRSIIENIVPSGHYLITGVDRLHGSRLYNSIMAYNHRGKIVAHYDKFHLVPFGEYLPFRNLFPKYMYNISNGLIDFEAGHGPTTISLGHMPSFSPLICYESLFPKEVIEPRVQPKFLINFTNDAWYGDTSGPYQHFDMTRLRAVEFGIPMIRAANTGISAVIDSYGRIISYLSLNNAGVIQRKIPLPLKYTSIFSKYGNNIIIFSIIIIVGTTFLCSRKQDD